MSLFKPAEALPAAVTATPDTAAAQPPVMGTQPKSKSQKKGPAQSTFVGGAASGENLGNKTLVGQ